MPEKAVITDIKDKDVSESVKQAFEAADILPLINKSKKIYIHTPVGATLFHGGVPVEATYLDVELAEAIINVCGKKPIIIYETPATAHRNIESVFKKLKYNKLENEFPQVQVKCFKDDPESIEKSITFDYGFDYPPVILPKFLFNKENLIISFSNPKAPFSNSVAGFQGLPFSLSGKSLIIGSLLFSKKNLMHFAFSDMGIGLKGFIIDAIKKIYDTGVSCIGINGGHFAGALIDNVNVNPVNWDLLVISSSLGIADVVTANLMGFDLQKVGFFNEMVKNDLLPSDFSDIDVIELGNGRSRIANQLKFDNPFSQKGQPITNRQWVFGLLKQMPFGERLKIMGKTVPSIIKYKITKKGKD